MEPSGHSAISETIAELADTSKPVSNSRLTELSNLNSAELSLFTQTWATMKPRRRRQIISRLVELAEDNIELNYDNIFKHCLKDPDAEVRREAIEGLWENEESSLSNVLINLLEKDSSEQVQAAAATALGKFALLTRDNRLRPEYEAKICQALLNIFGGKSKPVEVRRRALEAAAPLSLPQVTEAILEAYQSQEPRLRISAIYAMGKHGDPSQLPMLLKELSSKDTETRYEAAGACGEMGEEEASPYLIKLTSDPDSDVRLAAIQALGKIGGSKAKEHLKRCLKSPSEAIREAAEQALQELEAAEEPLSFRIELPGEQNAYQQEN